MKQTYLCVHKCVLRGAVVRKGATVTIDASELKLPGNEALSSASSFKLIDEASNLPPLNALIPPNAPIAVLRQKLTDLKVTFPPKATIEELKALLEAATNPDGKEDPA